MAADSDVTNMHEMVSWYDVAMFTRSAGTRIVVGVLAIQDG